MSSSVAVLLLALATTAISAARGGKILIYPGGACYSSHTMVMESLAFLLASNGHNVTMLVSSSYNGPKGDVDLSAVKLLQFPAPSITSFCDIDIASRSVSVVELIYAWQRDVNSMCEAVLAQAHLLSRLKSEAFDMFIVDNVDLCSRILIDFVDIPFAVFATAPQQPLTRNELQYYVQVPHMMLPFTNEMTLAQRIANTLIYLSIEMVANFIFLPSMQRLKEKYGLNASLTITDTYERSAVNFLYTDFAIDYPHATMPNSIPVGTFFAESRNADHLRGELKHFVDASQTGVLVVSFGSRIDKLPAALHEAFISAFKRMPYDVVWRCADGARVTDTLNNSMAMPWLPQADLLAHPNTRLLISHGGMSSYMEAAYNGVPVVAIPMHSEEQYQSLKMAQYMGMGVNLDANELSSDDLYAAIREVIDNPVYRENALDASRLIRDKPMVAREQILFWVDYVIRHRGGSRKPRTRALRWYQTFLLDVIAVLLACAVVILLIVGFTCRMLFSAVRCRLTRKAKLFKSE